jgi:hypothetical protein
VPSFPEVVTRATSKQTTEVTSHIVNLPTGIVNGDLLIVVVAFIQVTTGWTFPAGWKYVDDRRNINGANGEDPSTLVYAKRAEGEGATITVTTVDSSRSVHRAWRIRGWFNSTYISDNDDAPAGAVPAAVDGTGDDWVNAAPDPPSHDPQGTTLDDDDILWIAMAAAELGEAFTGYPASYDNTFTDTTGSGPKHISLAVAERKLHTLAENPGAFALGASRASVVETISIMPAAIAHMVI